MLETMSNIPIKVAAEVIGIAPQTLRVGLQQQRIPIGSAVQTSNQWTYIIPFELLKNYVGIERIRDYEKNQMEKCY